MQSGSAPDDRSILNRLANDDVTALREIMQSYSRRLGAVATIITESQDLSQEAVQDAFIRLWEKRKALNPDTKIFGYLVMSVRHRALDLMRHEQMHGRITSDMYNSGQMLSYNDGEAAVEAGEAQAVIQRALSELSPRCREVFLLHKEARLSSGEIEKLLGMSNGAVRVQISRAGAYIGQALQRWMAGK